MDFMGHYPEHPDQQFTKIYFPNLSYQESNLIIQHHLLQSLYSANG